MRTSLERPLFSLGVKRILHRNRVRDVLLIPAMKAQGVSVHSERTPGQVSARYGREQDHKYYQGYMTQRRK